jgi:hypothetical protein
VTFFDLNSVILDTEQVTELQNYRITELH